MANRYQLLDYGATIYYESEIWDKNGTSTSNLPNTSLDGASGDVGNISAVTGMSIADAQGRNSYTGAEMACQYKYPTPNVSVGNTATSIILASVPVSGVLRVWWGNNPGTNYRFYVNDILVIDIGDYGGLDSFSASAPINVAAGDEVKAYQSFGGPVECWMQIIPFSYTNPG